MLGVLSGPVLDVVSRTVIDALLASPYGATAMHTPDSPVRGAHDPRYLPLRILAGRAEGHGTQI